MQVGRRSVAHRRSVANNRASVATTPQELGEKQLKLQHGNVRVGDKVWLQAPKEGKPKNADEVYLDGTLHAITSGGVVKVRMNKGGAIKDIPIASLIPGNADSGHEDICTLTQLNEATVLDNVQVRFAKGEVYTWISTILVAMNPFETKSELYAPSVLEQYRELNPRSAPPHVYAVAERAFRGVTARIRPKSQSIVVSGESGAGKTFANRLLLSYLSYRSGANSSGASIAKVDA